MGEEVAGALGLDSEDKSEHYYNIISLPQDHPEAPWNQEEFVEEHAMPWGDFRWNMFLNQVEEMPSQPACSEAKERARLWEELQKPRDAPVATGENKQRLSDSQPTAVCDGVVFLNEL